MTEVFVISPALLNASMQSKRRASDSHALAKKMQQEGKEIKAAYQNLKAVGWGLGSTACVAASLAIPILTIRALFGQSELKSEPQSVKPLTIDAPQPDLQPVKPLTIDAPQPDLQPVKPFTIDAPQPDLQPVKPFTIDAPQPEPQPLKPLTIDAPQSVKSLLLV